MKADYVHKDTLTATDYVELNKNNELLMSYNQVLLKENKELKKKLNKANDELYTLKSKYNIRLLNQISENIEPDCEDYYLAEIPVTFRFNNYEYDVIYTNNLIINDEILPSKIIAEKDKLNFPPKIYDKDFIKYISKNTMKIIVKINDKQVMYYPSFELVRDIDDRIYLKDLILLEY